MIFGKLCFLSRIHENKYELDGNSLVGLWDLGRADEAIVSPFFERRIAQHLNYEPDLINKISLQDIHSMILYQL